MTDRVIFHAPTAGSLTRARRNLLNFRAAAPTAELRIIANAAAVAAALEHPDPDTDAQLVLCRTSLTRQGLNNDAGVAETDSAVVAIARLQQAGWQYIRA
jgi:NitT/TauT family transport system ATP-binding protein